MKALVLDGLKSLSVRDVPMPTLPALGALVQIMANGVCRSDWHIWCGDIIRSFPTIMGHEMAGVVIEVAPGVTRFKPGDRVVVPFSGSDGTCPHCLRGSSHLCDNRMVPSREYTGGYAEFVGVPLADRNLISLPAEIDFVEGAALGCRFMTAFHGLVGRACVQSGEWIAIFGCGGVGLSAVNIASSMGCQVVGIDLNPKNLELAKMLGAQHCFDARDPELFERIKCATGGGAHVSVDALGVQETCTNAILSLRTSGRHLQIGVTTRQDSGYLRIPIDQIVLKELSIVGSIGMPTHRYDLLLPLVANKRLVPGSLVTSEISLSEVEGVFQQMSNFEVTGTHVVTSFT